MPDVFTKEKRSDVMSKIRGKGNKETELLLMQIMRRGHIKGWRRNQAIFGKPDFIFPARKVAIFVDGCFWHGCPKHATKPGNNKEFWERKLQSNKLRDKRVTRELKRTGWKVVRFWEHELKYPDRVTAKLLRYLGQ